MNNVKIGWRKHSLETHFAGVKLALRHKREDASFYKCLHSRLIDCLGEQCDNPFNSADYLSDGVFHNRITNQGFVKFDGVWYTYDCGRMFKYYSKQIEVIEIDLRVRKTLVDLSNTKYATKHQVELVEHIKTLEWIKGIKIDAFKKRKRLKSKIEYLNKLKDGDH